MNWKILMRIARYIRPQMRYIVLALVAGTASVALSLWVPVLIGNTVDAIVGKGQVDFAKITPVLLKMAVAVVGSAFCLWLMTLCTNRVTYYAVKNMRIEAFGKLQQVPLSYIDGSAHGDLISRLVNDIEQVSDGLLQGFSQLFTGVLTIIGTLLFMLHINASIALVVILITPLSFFVASFIARRTFRVFRQQMQQRGEIGGYTEEMIGGHSVVKAFHYGDSAQQKFEELNAQLYKSGVKSQFYSSLTNPSTRFINALVYAGVGVFGALSAIAGGISIGQLSSFLIYAGQYTKPFNEISGVITELQTAIASAGRVFEVIDHPVEMPDERDAVEMKRSQGNIGMEQVCFSYTPDTKLIEGLNLYAKSGERVAIVGPTGAGKSTLINLLMRFYDVDSGEITVDGVAIKTITRNSLRALYGMVLQESWLFAGSVKQNIAFGKPDATDAEIIQAAKLANAHGFIRRLPNGYDTILTGDDGGISQGQMQLLCIARVMLTKPPMLILDEATSSIDTRTELKIQKAFAKMMQGRTSFVVAHRLSTIREADTILVMKDGGIVEQGSHAELLEQNGFYAYLYNSQFERR